MGSSYETKLKGHTSPVLCLDHSRLQKEHKRDNHTRHLMRMNDISIPTHSLLSGSEDGTARLWDLRNSTRASLCIVVEPSYTNESKEVTSVAFHPVSNFDTNFNHNYFTVYVTVGSNVYGYDLRYINSPITKQPDFSLTSNLQVEEEINQLSVSYSSNNSHNEKFIDTNIHLAVADDFGKVHITSQLPHKNYSNFRQFKSNIGRTHSFQKVLNHRKNEISGVIATSCAFRPHSKTLDIATGGTDCTVNLWDLSCPRVPLSSYNVEPIRSVITSLCNPPVVHCLSWSPSGRLLAVGLGDGSVSVLKIKKRKLVEVYSLCNAHYAATACITFPSVFSRFSGNSLMHDRLLVTSGNDGTLFLWDIGPRVAGGSALNPNSFLVGSNSIDSNRFKISSWKLCSRSSLSRSPSCHHRTESIFGLKHGKKPNFLICGNLYDQNQSPTLYLADTSNDITIYTLCNL